MGENYLDSLKLSFDEDVPVITGVVPASTSLPPKPVVKLEKNMDATLAAPSAKKNRDGRDKAKQGSAKRLKMNLDACPSPREWLERNVDSVTVTSPGIASLFSQFVQFPQDMESWTNLSENDACDRVDIALLQV